MNDISNVLIVEKNCAQLIALTVWLKQFPELHVLGTMSGESLKQSMQEDCLSKYHLIIYGLEISDSEEVPIELALALSLIRKIKCNPHGPAVILLSHYLNNNQTNNVTAQICQQLLRESDGRLSLSDPLIDFHHEITRLLSYRKTASILNTRVG